MLTYVITKFYSVHGYLIQRDAQYLSSLKDHDGGYRMYISIQLPVVMRDIFCKYKIMINSKYCMHSKMQMCAQIYLPYLTMLNASFTLFTHCFSAASACQGILEENKNIATSQYPHLYQWLRGTCSLLFISYAQSAHSFLCSFLCSFLDLFLKNIGPFAISMHVLRCVVI